MSLCWQLTVTQVVRIPSVAKTKNSELQFPPYRAKPFPLDHMIDIFMSILGSKHQLVTIGGYSQLPLVGRG